MKQDWFYKYLGKPWEAVPTPPESYNCGELVRAIYKNELNIELPAILIDNARNTRQCIEAMRPDMFGFLPLSENQDIKDFDLALLGKKTRLFHCGLAINAVDGLKILHCPDSSSGVCLDDNLGLLLWGFPVIKWHRHKDLYASD